MDGTKVDRLNRRKGLWRFSAKALSFLYYKQSSIDFLGNAKKYIISHIKAREKYTKRRIKSRKAVL